MKTISHSQLINFLQEELLIPADSIATAMRHPEQNTSLLPIILWQYGLVTLDQLDRIFDWLERQNFPIQVATSELSIPKKLSVLLTSER